MPRGNDTEHAQAFDAATMDQYGIHANAEEMIRAHRGGVDPALSKASLLQPDADATEEALSDLGVVRKKLNLDKDAVILDATVRGNAVIAVVENENGVAEKVVGGWNDDYVAPKLGPAEALARAEIERDRQVAQEIASLKAEQDEKLEELRREMEEKFAAQVEKLQGKADKDLEKTEKEIEKESGEADSSKGSSSGGSKSKSSGSKKSGSKATGEKSSGSAETSATGSGPAGAGGSTRSPEEKKRETKQD